MLIRIRHQLRFAYARPVFLEPTTVRLTPRQDAMQRLIDHTMHVEPSPAGATWTIEPEGTDARVLWFSGEHDRLSIESESLVRTLRENPFDALVTDSGCERLPVTYAPALTSALVATIGTPPDGSVATWSSAIAEEVDRATLPFLVRLTETIHHECSLVSRDEGDPVAAEETLAGRVGACRDLTALFLAACRTHGLAGRFVSGYSLHHPPDVPQQELHAWAEVYLPGAGWRGYDPSLGLAVADGHVALACGPDHRTAAAVSGSYRGTAVDSELKYHVAVSRAEAEE